MTQLIRESGQLAGQLFNSDTGFKVFTKPDGSNVTSIDFAVHEHVISEARRYAIGVCSEEEGSTAGYGDNRVLHLDPIDSTTDIIEGYQRRPRRSNAAPSLGLWDNGLVAGAVAFPLLGGEPIVYTAENGLGAYRQVGKDKQRFRLDTAPTRGVVFVSSKQHKPQAQAVTEKLRALGFTPVAEHGAVFKACCLADKQLLERYPYNKVHASGLPVVGFVSQGLYLYDIAAADVIVRAAGGVTMQPRNHGNKQPWVAANNPVVQRLLMQVIA